MSLPGFLRLVLAACAFLSLTACPASNTGTDGYSFDRDQATPAFTDFRVTFTLYDSVADLRRAAKTEHGVNLPEDRALYGFAILDNRSSDCHVHVVNPKVTYMPEWIGHELTHCIYGEWHP